MGDAAGSGKSVLVYTRKSTEEGLEQDYNSIDAQRDAGQAYIASQRHEGWIWDALYPIEQHRIMHLIVQKVVVSPTRLDITFHPSGIANLVIEVAKKPIEKVCV